MVLRAVMVVPVVTVARAVPRVSARMSLLAVRVVTPVPVVAVAVARRTARPGPSVVLAVTVARAAPRVPVARAATGAQEAMLGRPLMVVPVVTAVPGVPVTHP